MRRRIAPGAAVALALAAGAPLAASSALAAEAPWVGYWAADVANCKLKGQAGKDPLAPFKLTAKEWVSAEQNCVIASAKAGPLPRTWVVEMACQAEGEQVKVKRLYVVGPGDQDLHEVDEDGTVVAFHRCK